MPNFSFQAYMSVIFPPMIALLVKNISSEIFFGTNFHTKFFSAFIFVKKKLGNNFFSGENFFGNIFVDEIFFLSKFEKFFFLQFFFQNFFKEFF